MRKLIGYCLVILFVEPLYTEAQENLKFDDNFNLWNVRAGQQATVFVAKAYVRKQPNLKAAMVDSLSVGNVVTITSPPFKGNTIKNFYAPWHEITYTKDGIKKTGFIWLGLLALGKQSASDGSQYIYGFERLTEISDEQNHFSTGVKILDANGDFLAEHTYPFTYSGQTFAQSKLLPAMGLQNVKQILRMEFLGEACGIPSEYYYMAWTGKQLIDLPSRYSVADAGIYYYDEKMLFPSEHGKNNQIIYKYIEEGEALDENAKNPNFKITKKQEEFQWGGTSFQKVLTSN
ncbi:MULTISPECIES: hypothetical protein [unclassified Sphingobacterium]|uniref:hypothetical protein n=1 Tax=unclassified Sphingobacterium TaxID=2609468 RepID=UPI0025D8F3DD|nr:MULTISPECIES: hypothetical protein [unclassified Sphingobacterium]